MTRLLQDIDDLDRMVDTGAQKDAIRGQIRVIERQVAALEADYASLAENHTNLQTSQPVPLSDSPAEKCPFCKRATLELVEIKASPNPHFAMMGFKQRYYKCSNPSCGKNYDRSANPEE